MQYEKSLPLRSGIGLKSQHFEDILNQHPPIGWLEIHPENYMCSGGPNHKYLTAIRKNYALSMHGVGMSLGSSDGIDDKHLLRLKTLVDRYQPEQVSEHLAWSHWRSSFLNDLLPLPYSQENLNTVIDNVDKVQNTLHRTILIENPSTYLAFSGNDSEEYEFLNNICKQSGCGLLLDINNVYVSSQNNQFDPFTYLDHIDSSLVGEIHLAGHQAMPLIGDKQILVDNHGAPIIDEVWKLFEYFISISNQTFPVLIERDTNIPDLNELLDEASIAEKSMQKILRQSVAS